MITDRSISDARTLLETGQDLASAQMPEVILSSWTRCRSKGLDPTAKPNETVLSGGNLRDLCQKHQQLLTVARPELELLGAQQSGGSFICAIADPSGVILDAIMDNSFAQGGRANGIRPGSVWHEDTQGTNALGLALKTQGASIVTGAEHYFDCHKGLSCVSAPIFASDGTVAGLLDVSTEQPDRLRHKRALVDLSAASIENSLFVQTHAQDHILAFHPRPEYLLTQSVGLLALDAEGLITGANRNATALLPETGSLTATRFVDLFLNDFNWVLDQLQQCTFMPLHSQDDAAVFVKLHNNPASGTSLSTLVGSPIPENNLVRGTLVASLPEPLILDDSHARDCAKRGARAVQFGLPVCIRGASGTGKNALAQHIHHCERAYAPLVMIDCSDLLDLARKVQGRDRLLQALLPTGVSVACQGSVLVEDVGNFHLGTQARDGEGLERLRIELAENGWSFLLTGPDVQTPDERSQSTQSRILDVVLSPLTERTDFGNVAHSLLAQISTRHSLSVGALKRLGALDRPDNLKDLRYQLQVLAAQCPAGVLRKAQVSRFFPEQNKDLACPRCEGTPIRRKRCLEIRKVFRDSQGNVALTARRLGVSRNTVYTHVDV